MIEKITILLVDDHKIVREGLNAVLSLYEDFRIIGEAQNGNEAISLCRQHKPDIVLMDLIMPDMDGITATRKIKQDAPDTEIIVLTSFHEDSHIFPAIQAGALSYLLKDVDAGELVQAIRRAAKGESMLHPQVTNRVLSEVGGHTQPQSNVFTKLSERELEVLTLIASGKNNAQIAEELILSLKTVKRHVSNILAKLEVNDRTQAAVLAWREGVVRR